MSVNIQPFPVISFNVPTDGVVDKMLWQYRGAENLQAYIKALAYEIDAITKATEDTINLRYLADAFGYQLDVIGEIVGQGRVFYGAASLGYFGFYDEPQSAVPSIGDIFDVTVGGIYKGLGDKDSGDLVLGDEAYRRSIYAKIIQNGSNCRINHMLTFIDLITGVTCNTEITEPNPCEVHINIKEDLTQPQRINASLLLPNLRPVGVKMTAEDNYGVITLAGPSVVNGSIEQFRRLYDF